MDAGPWLPQCITPPAEAAEYYHGRGGREPTDWETTATYLGKRDLPRVNAEMEKFGSGAAGTEDPAGSQLQPKPKAALIAQSRRPMVSSQPRTPPIPPRGVSPRPPRVVEPRPGYGPSAESQQWWEGQWWGSSQDAWNSWEAQAGWYQRW